MAESIMGQSTTVSTPLQTAPLLSYFASGQVGRTEAAECHSGIGVSSETRRSEEKRRGLLVLFLHCWSKSGVTPWLMWRLV